MQTSTGFLARLAVMIEDRGQMMGELAEQLQSSPTLPHSHNTLSLRVGFTLTLSVIVLLSSSFASPTSCSLPPASTARLSTQSLVFCTERRSLHCSSAPRCPFPLRPLAMSGRQGQSLAFATDFVMRFPSFCCCAGHNCLHLTHSPSCRLLLSHCIRQPAKQNR